jgi:hypothetical protein
MLREPTGPNREADKGGEAVWAYCVRVGLPVDARDDTRSRLHAQSRAVNREALF